MENLTLIYLLIGSTALNLVTLYVIRNVLRKNEKQEDILVKYLNYLDSLSKTIAYIDEKLSKIDVKGRRSLRTTLHTIQSLL